MLLSVVLTLRPSEDCILPMTIGNAIHGYFLKLVEQEDSLLARRLHAAESEKPFTVSTLQGGFTVQDGDALLKGDQTYWLRFTSLNQELSDLLLSLNGRSVPTVSLSGREFEVVSIARRPEEHPWAKMASFDQLYEARVTENGPVPTRLRIRFFSPTTFRSGQQNLPFPVPRLVFLTLAEKWNRYAPIHLGSEITLLVDEFVALARYELKTRIFDFGRYRQVGFVGDCEFRISARCEELWTQVIHFLADFAFFAGIGYKTTMGMGQTRRIDGERTHVR